MRLQTAMPALSAKIDSVHGSIMAKIDELRHESSKTSEIAHRLSSELGDVISGRAPIYISRAPEACSPMPRPMHLEDSSEIAHMSQNITGHAIPPLPPPPPPVPEYKLYKLSRRLFTVEKIWKEYKVGLGTCPSVESLEQRFGARWRSSDSERKFFSRRQKIYKAIADIIAQGQTEIAAVKALDDLRIANRWSLDKLQKQTK